MAVTDQIHRTLGRYELLFLLGQGGMGEVHLARLSGAGGFEKLCIVKTILPQMKAETQFVERFHHEARVLTHLTHSNIAQVYDMGEADGTLFMAIEYVPGVDLARIETRSATTGTFLPLPIALHIGRLMCDALGYAHRKTSPEGTPLGIVHRDVSPQNVMVSYEGEVKVIDFGLAKSAGRSKHTLPATVMGKLGYMSPEQALAKTVDHRSDIYSAGIVIWEMIAGRPLYQGGTMAEMVAMMANPTIPSLRTVREDVSEALDAVVLRALEKDPAARYNRGDEFARGLNEIAVREGLSISAEEAGNFIRAMCPEEFAAERNLQSQLSLLRKGGARAPSAPGHHLKPKSGTVSAAEELDGTFVRQGDGSSPAPQMTPAQRALSMQGPASNIQVAPSIVRRKSQPGADVEAPSPPRQRSQPKVDVDDDAPIAPKRSAAPLVIVALLALVGLGVGGYVAFGRDTPSPTPPPAVEPLKAVAVEPVAVEPVAVVEPVKAVEPVAALDAGAAIEPAVRARLTPKGTVFKVIRRSDGAYIDLEKGQRLREGDRLRLVGEPVEGRQREVFGQARVLELKARGTVAELLMEEDDAHPESLFAFVDETVPDRPKLAKVTKDPKDPAMVPVDFPVGPNNPKTTKPDDRPTEPPLNPVAEVKPVEVKPLEKKPEPAALPRIDGQVIFNRKNSGLLGPSTVVRVIVNSDSPSGTGCDVHLPNGLHQVFSSLRPRDNKESDLSVWKSDPRPDPNKAKDYALVECKDAAGYFKYTAVIQR
ncbi:MAG: serine/threonine-protein kinase [Myxococcales bacterium]|nr:serine/threonine-protein kinase [Myxococcales bacterium]